MPVHMKKLRTDDVEIIVREGTEKKFRISREVAHGLILILNEYRKYFQETVPADEVFREIDEKYSRPGAALQGARLKEDLSQVELAEKLGISQADLSKMEHGKRSIGKAMAKRLARYLKIDYRIFL